MEHNSKNVPMSRVRLGNRVLPKLPDNQKPRSLQTTRIHNHRMGDNGMISTNQLESTLKLMENAEAPETEEDEYWYRGATDVLRVLIKHSKEDIE